MYFFEHPVCIVSRPKLEGPGTHWGVRLPDGSITDHTTTGPRVVSYEEFAQNRPVAEVRRARPEERWNVHPRLLQALTAPASYNLLANNCQHYANWLIGEKPESPEIEGTLLVCALAGAFFYFRTQK